MDALSRQYLASVSAAKCRFLANTRKSREQQTALLADILKANADSRFGREHGFGSVSSTASYQSAVPIRPYAELAPWIERAAAGAGGELTSAPPVLFHRTSSTTGAPKKIPFTAAGALVSFRSFGAHHAMLYETHPEALDCPDATLSLTRSPPTDTVTSGGIPWCFASETDWTRVGMPRHPGTPGLRAPWTVWPERAEDVQYYRVITYIESPLRAIRSWFPASVLHVADVVRRDLERLIREVHDGTVCGRPTRAPNKPRARQLEAAGSAGGHELLRRVWPTLTVVECWTSATSALYLDALRQCLGPEVDIFPCGYICTENPIGFVADGDRRLILDVTSAFFEFLPAEGTDDRALLHHELEIGREYSIVMTTMSGLYRYALGDVVRILDFIDDVPLIEFRYRRHVVTSLIAEKMTEGQILNAIVDCGREFGWGRIEASLCPLYGVRPHYVLAVERPGAGASTDEDALSDRLDVILQSHNSNYAFFRSTGLVASARVRVLCPGTFAARRAALRDIRGANIAQQKHRVAIDAAELDELQRTSGRLEDVGSRRASA